MATKKISGVRSKKNKDQLGSELLTTEPITPRTRGRPRISQCSHSKAPSCDDQRVDPVIENNKDGESNNSDRQDGEKSEPNVEENVKHFTQMLQQGVSNFRAMVAKCDELQNENHELRKKLETSLAKLEEYEKVKLLLTESIQAIQSLLGLSPLPSSTDSPKPPESPKPDHTKNTRKAAGGRAEAPPKAIRRKISSGMTV
ncbi:hypothetical protein AQUCO_02600419v1 [Aquilegia coerulea]|uniref:Uncharacterized protein n=1 Tax=Aquilegia coerulea TaxID=218851 RepID=A0A2G5D8W7_AQUCA|nr:hypothetical protein AQUCO_02600419v1 [Aquilegia coerulea]